jgi:transcriptional regulator with XRE-family HTH domain
MKEKVVDQTKFMILDKQLRELIKKHNLNVVKLGRAVKVSPKTIYQWLNGQTPRNLKDLKAIADYFNVSLDYLTFGEASKEKPMSDLLNDVYLGEYEVILRKLRKK